MTDPIPFSKEELAKMLEDANRMITMLRERAEALEKALRSLDAAVSEALCKENVVIAPVVRESLGRALRSARGTGSR